MDRSECKAIVERHLPGMVAAFGLGHWDIRVEYGPRDNPHHDADCGRNVNYTRATIGFDPDRYDDEGRLVRDLRHELFHVVVAPFDVLWHLATVGATGDRLETLERVFTFSVEQTILALERAYRGLTEPGGAAGKPKPKGRPRG